MVKKRENEQIQLMSNAVLRQVLQKVQKCGVFSLICDETTDMSTHEQMSICLRYVDEDLISHENFIGFYELQQTDAATIVTVIKDVLLRCNLSITQCRGQCYDGASNMSGIRSGVAARISEIGIARFKIKY